MIGDAVVYLLWAPAGREPVQRFLHACATHRAGVEHTLVVALSGAESDEQAAEAERWLDGVDCLIERFDGPRIDLGTYRELVDRIAADRYYFMNSYCEPLAGDWLAKWRNTLTRPEVGVVGPAGSYESFVRWTTVPLQPLRVLRFKRYPSPHIRTSCFAVERSTIERLDWPPVMSKENAWAFESGRHGLTAQVQRIGLAAVVVGRDGVGYEVERWRESATFRAGGQRNLLIADKRTHDYEDADERQREFLAKLAWGSYDGVQ